MIFSACGSKGDVVAGVEDHLGLGKHCVVLDLGLPDSGAVVGEDDQLGFTSSEASEGRLVAEDVLSTLDDQAQFGVDVVVSSFLCHCESTNKLNIIKIII